MTIHPQVIITGVVGVIIIRIIEVITVEVIIVRVDGVVFIRVVEVTIRVDGVVCMRVVEVTIRVDGVVCMRLVEVTITGLCLLGLLRVLSGLSRLVLSYHRPQLGGLNESFPIATPTTKLYRTKAVSCLGYG